MTGRTISKPPNSISRPIPRLSGRFRGYRCVLAVLYRLSLLYRYLKSSLYIGVSVSRGRKMTHRMQLLVALFVVFMVHSAIAGPLNQLNSLIKTKYGEESSRKKTSLKQEREQLYEAYNLLHSLAQVRLFVLCCYPTCDARIKSLAHSIFPTLNRFFVHVGISKAL